MKKEISKGLARKMPDMGKKPNQAEADEKKFTSFEDAAVGMKQAVVAPEKLFDPAAYQPDETVTQEELVVEVPVQEQAPVYNDWDAIPNQTTQNINTAQEQTKMEQPKTDKGINAILSNLGRRTRSGNGATGSLTTLKENIEESLDDTGLTLFILNDSSRLATPAIVLFKAVANSVRYYAVIAEALLFDGKLAPIEEYIQNTKIQIDMPASKCYNKTYRSVVEAAIAKRFPGKQVTVKPTSYLSVSKDKDLKDKTLSDVIVDTAEMAISEAFQPSAVVTSDVLKANGLKISLQNDILPNSTVTFSEGAPIACDAVIRVQAAANSTDKTDVNSGGAALTLSKVAVKFDMFKQDPRMSNGQFYQSNTYGANQMPTQAYHPVLIMTESEGLNTESGSSLENVGTHMLGALSTALLASGQNFLSFFTQGGGNKKSLGVLGYDHTPWSGNFVPAEIEIENAPVATKENALTPGQVAECYFHTGSMTLAMDIRQGGRSAWAQKLFLAIADGKDGANEAGLALLDKILDNKFSPIWASMGGGSLIRSQTVMIHNGHYGHTDGTDHDIRDIDYLYLLGLLKEQSSDVNVGVAPYTQSFVPGATNGAEGLVRMHLRRLNISLVSPDAVFTGLSERVFFAPNFLAAAMQAMVSAKITLNPEGLYDQATTSQLMQGFIPGVAVDANMTGQVFQTQFTGPSNQQCYSHNNGSYL